MATELRNQGYTHTDTKMSVPNIHELEARYLRALIKDGHTQHAWILQQAVHYGIGTWVLMILGCIPHATLALVQNLMVWGVDAAMHMIAALIWRALMAFG